ncbi:hypothetical protein FGG08_000066 [Glutinoglossum americanum]|uniref:Uncharacterized protein n=1 Tax=Glutinoglossum americanum TaxID=1670608 RepID=A0A9P8IDZ5_9PEZI|nr:hypothetical protein FGG08_000066 [Glutinoglossum americanum]
MPHIPPRAPSRDEEEHDGSEFKTGLLTEKQGDIMLSAPTIPDRGMFGEPTMEPARAMFHHARSYSSSLSDASEGSSGSHSCLDDDDPEPTNPTAVAAEDETETKTSADDDMIDADNADGCELVDCMESPNDDFFEAIDNSDFKSDEAGTGTGSLEFLTGGCFRGDIAVVISYAFVGKPKMVDIPHSPRSSNDSRRWGKFVSPTPETLNIDTPVTPASEKDGNNSDSETQPPAPTPPSDTTPSPSEAEPHFLTQPAYTTISCSDDSTASKSSAWRGLVRSVSRRRRQTPKEKPENNVVVEAGKLEKPSRRPRGLGIKLSRSAKSPGAPQTPVTPVTA